MVRLIERNREQPGAQLQGCQETGCSSSQIRARLQAFVVRLGPRLRLDFFVGRFGLLDQLSGTFGNRLGPSGRPQDKQEQQPDDANRELLAVVDAELFVVEGFEIWDGKLHSALASTQVIEGTDLLRQSLS